MSQIAHRLLALRQLMHQHGLDALIVPSSDPHDSEYPAPHWQCREWISGFNGSAGTILLTPTEALLWTDSRYFIQATQQLEGSTITLMREGESTTPTIGQWIAKKASTATPTFTVGIGGENCPLAFYEQLLTETTGTPALRWTICQDLFAQIWTERPPLPHTPLQHHDQRFYLPSARQKISTILSQLPPTESTHQRLLISDLSEIAWTLNLRAADIDFNPLFYAYLLVGTDGSHLYTDLKRIAPEVAQHLHEAGIATHPYEDAPKAFELPASAAVQYYSAPTINLMMKRAFEIAQNQRADNVDSATQSLKIITSPVAMLRARKDEREIEGFRKAMLHDGVALAKFGRWLDDTLANGSIAQENEHTIGQSLTNFRRQHPDFAGLSFATIAGYEANGAIVHYEATPHTAATLAPKGFLLLDSGAHYLSGTTDITRTYPLGQLTEEQRRAYTLVLKGNIALSRAKFPRGTSGIQLDLAARYAMWQQGYDFGHGTGHGVGARLCVHEGPMQIRKDQRPATAIPLAEGMVLSNEPGIYVTHKFGIRLENILLVKTDVKTDFGDFLSFEVLTLCPFATEPLIIELLEDAEIQWLNDYHQTVRQQILPHLSDPADRQWLTNATAPIARK